LISLCILVYCPVLGASVHPAQDLDGESRNSTPTRQKNCIKTSANAHLDRVDKVMAADHPSLGSQPNMSCEASSRASSQTLADPPNSTCWNDCQEKGATSPETKSNIGDHVSLRQHMTWNSNTLSVAERKKLFEGLLSGCSALLLPEYPDLSLTIFVHTKAMKTP
jgi:hypothetical protein